MSDLELTMMRRVGELNKENARLKAEVEELKSQPDPLTAYLYAAELAKDDIKRLKAEVEAVRQEYSDATNHYNRLHNDLQAQVERLTKAGDNLERILTGHVSSYEVGNASHEWRAAKGGKR